MKFLASNVIAILVGSTTLSSAMRAAEPLRWSLKAGDRLGYSIVQEMTISNVAGGEDKLQSKTRQQSDVLWQVKSVNNAGDAVIEYRFDRIRSQMTLPTGNLEYDSAKEGPPAGMAAINAPLYSALVKSPAEITLSPAGVTRIVTVPAAVQAALKRMPTSAAIGDLGKPDVFHTSFLPGFPQLPSEALDPGFQWSSKTTADLATAGKQTIETSYRYEGRRDVEGVSCAVIQVKRSIDFQPGATSQRRVKEQSSEGEVLFDTAAGRLRSSTVRHRATVAVTVDKSVTEQKIDQLIEVKYAPPKN